MARYFQTAQPQFVQDFVYTPPYELMDKLASTRQASYDNTVAQAKIFDNLIINHLNSEDENYNVQELQSYYSNAANNIAKTIQGDKLNASSYLGQLDSLKKELNRDFTTGNIAKIQGSYAAMQQWEKDNEQIKKDDPSRYQAARNYYMNSWQQSGANSLGRQWQGDLVTKDVDWQKLMESAKSIQANKWERQSAGPGGGYIYKNKSSGEKVGEDRIKGVIIGELIQDPSNMAALRQSQQFGLGTYFGEDGNLDYDAAGFSGINLFSRAYQYSKQSQEQDISSDPTAMAREQRAHDSYWKNQEYAYKINKDAADRVSAEAKSQDEKISGLEKEYARALIEDDKPAIAVWGNALHKAQGISGGYESNAGSIYGTSAELQAAAARGDKRAQGIINSTLPQKLTSVLDYKDPAQKKLAEKIVGLYKQNKLSEDGIADFLAKEIPKVYKPSEERIQLEIKHLKEKENLTSIPSKIGTRVSQLLGDVLPAGIAYPEMKRLESKIKNGTAGTTEKQRYNKLVSYNKQQGKEFVDKIKKPIVDYRSQAIKNIQNNEYLDDNRDKRNKLGKALKTTLGDFNTEWKDSKSKFSTYYETAPLSISAQGAVKTLLQDPNNSKDMLVENNGKIDYLKDSGIEIVKYVSVMGSDGRGRNSVIGLDENGKQYPITASPNSPVYKTLMNIAKSEVNPNTVVGMEVAYPTVARLRQMAEGSKILGQKGIRQPLQVNGKNYTIVGDASNGFYAIDENLKFTFGAKPGTKAGSTEPKKFNYVDLGVGLEKLK